MTLNLLLVDDSAHFLDAARTLFEREGLTVVGIASTSADALSRYDELRPDVTLVDIDLGDESGLDLARRLSEVVSGQAKVILISAYPESDVVDLVAATPAIGFLAKSDLSRAAIVDLLARTDGRGPTDAG
jgi:DNA-binding NarL/FixJ family response regulator